MKNFVHVLAATAAAGAFAAPAAAQYAPQPYPQYQQSYPQQAYPYQGQQYGQQGYGNPVTQIIDQLLGNRYNVSDRSAVSQCASAAMSQAAARYGNGYAGNGYDQRYPNAQNYGYNRGAAAMRVTAITGVERRRNGGLRVSGTMSSGAHYGGQQAYANGYRNNAYAAGDMSFRCNVDSRGQVSNIRLGASNGYGR